MAIPIPFDPARRGAPKCSNVTTSLTRPIEVFTFPAIVIVLLAAAVTGGCADTHMVTAGGYYCQVKTREPCEQLVGSGDCQPCPPSSMKATEASSP
jgi:hypothetical protein